MKIQKRLLKQMLKNQGFGKGAVVLGPPSRRRKRIKIKREHIYSRTYSVYAESQDGFSTATIVFGFPIEPQSLGDLDNKIIKALEDYFGPDSEITLPNQREPKW